MNKLILGFTLLWLTVLPSGQADNVTVHGTCGMLDAQLVTKTDEVVGAVYVWNTAESFRVVVQPFSDRFLLSKVYVYLSDEPAPAPAPDLLVEPDYGEWPYRKFFKTPSAKPYCLDLKLEDDLPYLHWGQWGEPWLAQRLVTVAVRVELKSIDAVPTTFTACAKNPHVPLEVQRTAWGDNMLAMRYELQHPMQGNFVGPVHGLGYCSWTHSGMTGIQGGFSFYPGEYIYLWIGEPFAGVYLGHAKADQRISPLDIFPALDIDDPAVVNLARLLLCLDPADNTHGTIDISAVAAATLQSVLNGEAVDFNNIEPLLAALPPGYPDDAAAWLRQVIGNSPMRRNVSKTAEYAVDKPKLDIMPYWVPARTANGDPATIEYRDDDGVIIETRDKAKPLLVTYTEEQNLEQWGMRRGADIITAVSMDDGATWKRFNVSHMAQHSSFTLKTGEKFPGDSRTPQQKIAENKILIVWTSAYARGGKPVVSIKTTDDYPYDDVYAVRDLWGVRGRQGSVNYDLDPDVGDQAIGEIPYYALWACRGVLVTAAEHGAGKFLDRPLGEIVWFKPERLTTGRRDAFLPVVGSAKNAGFAIAWQEDPGGLRPGKCSAGGHGWSGATVHKKTDIWYSFIRWADFDLVDANFIASEHSADEHGADTDENTHQLQPEISNRPKWRVPMSLPVRVSDNNTVNTDNMKVQLDESGMPVVEYGSFVPLLGAEEADWVRHEHEHDGDCGVGEEVVTEEEAIEHDGEGGTGGGWGMARYAYMLPELGPLADLSGLNVVWDGTTLGEYRPGELPNCRWYRFINQPGQVKTVAITPDGRVLDGDTGACRPNLTLMPYSYTRPDGTKANSAWAILGYEETKGLGTPPDEDHHAEETVDAVVTAIHDEDDDEGGEKGKDVIYHSFAFDQPERISAGHVVNLPALDDAGNLVPIYYNDAVGLPTGVFRQFATENARRVRFIAQPKSWLGLSRTSLLVLYKQGREGNGKPSDIFAVRAVVPTTDKATDNPYRFSNFQRFDTTEANPDENGYNRYQRKHMNMTSATVEAVDPLELAVDYQGQTYAKVARWKQYNGNLGDESFANPYSDAKGHRGFIRGDQVVIGYSWTPNWGRLGGDHLDFFVRRSFDGGQNWTTGPQETTHTVIEKDPVTREYVEKQYKYGPNAFEPGRNVSLLKGNKFTVTDPRLVPPMGPGTANSAEGYPVDDAENPNIYYVAFGTAEVLHGLADPTATDSVKADVFYSRTTDGGSTWLMVPWVINPNSASPDAGETVYRFPWLAQGTPHQGHAQIRTPPSGTRFYAIWHQFTDGDEDHVSPHDIGNDIWFRRIDFMTAP